MEALGSEGEEQVGRGAGGVGLLIGEQGVTSTGRNESEGVNKQPLQLEVLLPCTVKFSRSFFCPLGTPKASVSP